MFVLQGPAFYHCGIYEEPLGGLIICIVGLGRFEFFKVLSGSVK